MSPVLFISTLKNLHYGCLGLTVLRSVIAVTNFNFFKTTISIRHTTRTINIIVSPMNILKVIICHFIVYRLYLQFFLAHNYRYFGLTVLRLVIAVTIIICYPTTFSIRHTTSTLWSALPSAMNLLEIIVCYFTVYRLYF